MEVFIQKDLNLVALTNEMFWEYPLIYIIKTILYSSSLLDYSETIYIYIHALLTRLMLAQIQIFIFLFILK